MISKKLIAETDDVVAIEQNCGTSSVVVTFNEMGFVRNGLAFWGDSFFLKLGITAIGIVTPRPNWYPAASMNAIVTAVLEQTRNKRVVTYGHSQGGYGALKYSARLGASVALAFSPQWSIDPNDVESFDTRFIKYFDKSKSNGIRIEEADLCGTSFIFFDKKEDSDAANAARLTNMRNVRSVVVPFAKHDTIRIATEGRSASKIISLCTDGNAPEAADLRRILRSGRRQSNTYANYLSRELVLRMSRSKNRNSRFADCWIRTTAASPYYLALISHARGDASGAAAELGKLVPEALEGHDLVFYWQLANRLRFDEAELLIASKMLAQNPNNTWLCLHVVNTFIRTGKSDLAQTELTRLALRPDATSYLEYFAEFAMKLGRVEILESVLSQRLSATDEMAVQLKLVEHFEQSGERNKALRKLIELEHGGSCTAVELKRIADILVKINEFGFALEIRNRLLKADKDNIEAALDVVEARAPLDKAKSLSELNAVMSKLEISVQCLERASYLYERLHDLAKAESVINRAMSMPQAGPSVRHRQAYMMWRTGKIERARIAVNSLLVECAADPHRLRALGDLATNLPDLNLYQRCAEAQHSCDPTNPDAILYLARCYRIAGDRTRARELLAALHQSERRSASISDLHWVLLAQELFESGERELAWESAQEAFARQPSNVTVTTLLKTLSVLKRLGGTGASSKSSASSSYSWSPAPSRRMAFNFRRNT